MLNKKNVYIVFSVITLALVCTFYFMNSFNRDNFNQSNSYIDNVFFTKWLGYIGYSLSDKRGRIEISYIDFDKNANFEHNIESIELLPNSRIIEVVDFSIISGSSSNELDIKTLSIKFNLLKTGNDDINQLRIRLKNNVTLVWDIGNIKIDIREIVNTNYLELGVRRFIVSHFTDYSFTLINNSSSDILVLGLDYDMPKGIAVNKLKVSDTFDNIHEDFQANNEYLLKSNDKKVFSYLVEDYSEKQYFFYLLKPFLKYEYNGEKYIMMLDSMIYSGHFNDEVISEIKKNQGMVDGGG